MTGETAPRGVDPTVPSSARIYDALLGGKDNYESDREVVRLLTELYPFAQATAVANRAWLGRAVSYLADHGIRQFLDIGAGLPTQENVHQVAQAVDPGCRVVYVDNDPIVLSHGRALLTGTDNVRVFEGDLARVEEILAEARTFLDFERPVGVLLSAILHFFDDAADPYRIVATIRDALPPGSYLALTHGTVAPDKADEDSKEFTDAYSQRSSSGLHLRDKAQVARFLDGFEPVDPGVVYAVHWRPVPGTEPRPVEQAPVWAAVGRLP
ncbi:SAM-dependent methyltransferase [Actinocorallia sp. A-T 12471]|uniref:SAM-dependent methyltransferase n=1 Tax=Actinocorallia sp. A-T 12471 TaxID=3089813 RepID=UPI0029D2F60A|nr:SAM-dependent methyltransferase [Actinocorallia sp. A-T 12471]MDX6738157.1 SAM-dependent methyltransferase [Actinocorallia sp. A-T 12471]